MYVTAGERLYVVRIGSSFCLTFPLCRVIIPIWGKHGLSAENRIVKVGVHMNVREYLDILHTAERLKDTPRHCTTSRGRTESVAEHSWRVSLMAFLLKKEFPDADMNKVVDMCLIHDLGECFTGDIPTFLKTDADRKTEDSLFQQWIDSMPTELSKDISALYREMEAQETTEAKIYKALDKLEALIQHNESPLDTWADNEFELNKKYAFDAVAFSEWLTELRKAILEDTIEKLSAKEI
ncbi:HD domain-containing protein [Ruminococcus sp. YRD2003]|uniref:HD domain-containing protein n=1 Tax=Ruminococcus sp. YRD2003 TaxID=1452313 RepID=UPI0039B6F7C4